MNSMCLYEDHNNSLNTLMRIFNILHLFMYVIHFITQPQLINLRKIKGKLVCKIKGRLMKTVKMT